ncbi:MAG TPA: MBL fold metallo-hydrolase [Candidatus Nitrosotalea sp.]|nr:MBL fold metallo-hydrolase [Candidatus Nitrosotalea sp.]
MLKVTWFGQSAFLLQDGDGGVFIDPFGDMSRLTGTGRRWDYPAIEGAKPDLLLITHEHADHNAVDAVEGEPHVIRSLAGTFGQAGMPVVGIASEHDRVAGTQRGANVIFVFDYRGLRICHMGDFGQSALRPEQREAIGQVDLLFVPVGGSATIDGTQAASLVAELSPRWAVPMHYRSQAIDFLDDADSFLAAVRAEIVSLDRQFFQPEQIETAGSPVVVVPAAPLRSPAG